MNWITAISLFIVFLFADFIAVKALHSIIENKVWRSGLYCFIGWVVFFFGFHEYMSSEYYAVPITIGSVSGTMLSVYFKKKEK